MTNFEKVGIFMKTFGQEVKLDPSFSTDKINQLRLKLIKFLNLVASNILNIHLLRDV